MADALIGGIVINEILADPNGANNFDTDGNGTADNLDEYIELFNTSASSIDISGLELWDAGIGQWFTFPPGTVLAPSGHALVMTGVQSGGSLPSGAAGDLFFDAGRGAPLINNGGDNVTLYDPSSDTFVQAVYNGDSLDDPTLGAGGYSGFSSTASRIGSGEDFGNDVDGQSVQRTGDGADVFTTDEPTPGATNICFANGTQLATPGGLRAVEDLRVGDRVTTLDGDAVPVSWIFVKCWSVEQMCTSPNLAPICISQGAFGNGVPQRDLRLSQHHRILVEGPISQRMFGAAQVLVPAKALLALPGIYVEQPRQPVSYYHIMLDAHQVLSAEGLWSESLYLGPQALNTIPDELLQDALDVLGLTREQIRNSHVKPARHLASVRQGRNLIVRHQRNAKPLMRLR
ncbi:Lamin Tail Domain [Monaibacterium marinum]|uniref:Lamin Tail Domain n=1 Tax=Pontivivens marinum TaxID=1690039 RepID=A0A2C9CRN7_9RHOB|nr:Hint domain-containing protein [Monaibacterium marinum]SOH93917.1 Lamin Tail Domain [Monaibacterium marinum]